MTLNIINYLTNMDKNSRFLLIIIGIIVLLLIIIFVINYISDRKTRIINKRRRKLKKEINREAKNIVPVKKEKKEKKTVAPVTKTISVKNDIEEPVEVLEADEEIIEILQDDGESDIDRILKEIKKASKEETMNLTEFEREQEETAIISYDELCKKACVKKKIYKAVTEETMDVSKIVPEIKEKKYKPSKYVSPIFGVEKDKNEEELDKTFLQSLKEFRSTLD